MKETIKSPKKEVSMGNPKIGTGPRILAVVRPSLVCRIVDGLHGCDPEIVSNGRLAGVPFFDDGDPDWKIGSSLSCSESTGSLGKVGHDEVVWWWRVGVLKTLCWITSRTEPPKEMPRVGRRVGG